MNMNCIKKFIFGFALYLLLIINTNALSYKGCEYSEIARAKSLVNNINISYDYNIVDDVAYFDVTINNIMPGMYFTDDTNSSKYHYEDSNNGEFNLYGYQSSGYYKFYYNGSGCSNVYIGTKYYNFPIYNKYYNKDICSDYTNLSFCQKWTNVYYSYSTIEQKIIEYNDSLNKNKDDSSNVNYDKNILSKIIEFYIKYYYIILMAIIIILSIIIYIKNKKDRFKL